MKIIYTSLGFDPLKIIITDDILKRIIGIQEILKNLDQKKNEIIEWHIDDIKDEFNFTKPREEVFVNIIDYYRQGDIRVWLMAYECGEEIDIINRGGTPHYINLSEVPDIYFTEEFVRHCSEKSGKYRKLKELEDKNFHEAMKLMPKEHVDLLKNKIDEERKKWIEK